MCCIPEASAEYVASTEDVLDQHEHSFAAQYPRFCFDEGLKQLIEKTRTGYPSKVGRKERYDYEYKRNGVHSIINWQFRNENARIKLKQLYPSISA
jgi:hypothetical protein